jgi:amino acid transporter
MAEKEPEYAVDPSPDHHYNSEEVNKMEARRGSKVNEASDLYGDIQTAEEYGYVSRG